MRRLACSFFQNISAIKKSKARGAFFFHPKSGFSLKKYFGEMKEMENASTTFQKELGKLLKSFNSASASSKPTFSAYMASLEELSSLKMGLNENLEDYRVFFNNLALNFKHYKQDEKLVLAKQIFELNLMTLDLLQEVEINFLKDCQDNKLTASQVIQNIFLLNQTNFQGEYKNYEGVLMKIMNESLTRGGASSINSMPLQIRLQFLFLNQGVKLENKLLRDSVIKEIMAIIDFELFCSDKSPYAICEIAFLAFRIFFDKKNTAEILSSDQEMHFFKLVSTLLELFFFKDGAIYDLNLQKYEFQEYKGNQIGVIDPLSWVSLARCAEVLAHSNRFFNEDCFRRLEDGLMRKYETDIIDLPSAAKILYYNSFSYVTIDSNLYGRILDMIKPSLQGDKKTLIKSGLDSRLLLMLLEGVSRVFPVGKEVDVPSLLFTLDEIANSLLEIEKTTPLTIEEKGIIKAAYEGYLSIFDFKSFLEKIAGK